jgi:hypothetical protein
MALHAEDLYGILELPGDAGWRVAVVRKGQEFNRLFSSSRHGGKRQALKAAQAWRDHAATHAQAITKAEYVQSIRRNNTSGCPGVYLKRQRKPAAGGKIREFVFWTACTPDGITPRQSKSFSVARFGFDVAFEKAVQARLNFVQQLKGFHLPTVPKRLHPKMEVIEERNSIEAEAIC